MRPVSPRLGFDEHMIGEEQPEYLPLAVAIQPLCEHRRFLVTRWTLTPEERQRIAAGDDLYVGQLNFLEHRDGELAWQHMVPLTVGLRETFSQQREG